MEGVKNVGLPLHSSSQQIAKGETMKQDLITDVVQRMLPYLNNAQSKKLQEVLSYVLVEYDIKENQSKNDDCNKIL